MTLEGAINSWNPGAEKLFGYLGPEAVGKSVRIISPTDRENELPGIIKKIRAGERIERYETKRKRKDGTIIDVSLSISPIKDDVGEIVGISKIIRDITGQKLVAQYARSLIEMSQDPLVTISPDGKITDVNEATVKATGVARPQLVGTDFSNYFTRPEKARQGYLRAFKEGSVTDYPLTIRSTSGKLTDTLYNASMYRDMAARDYSHVKQANQQLEESNKELRKREKRIIALKRELEELRSELKRMD
jgi:PAS domain S-box-containing protein